MAYEDAGKDFSNVSTLESNFTYAGGDIQHMTEYHLDAGNPVPPLPCLPSTTTRRSGASPKKNRGHHVPEDVIVADSDDTEI
jgi:hypothetical protein